MFCNQCGKINPDGAVFCSSCGGEMTHPAEQRNTSAPGICSGSSSPRPLSSLVTDKPDSASAQRSRWIWSVVVGVLILVGVGGTLAIKGSGAPKSLGASGAHKNENGVWNVDVKINSISISLNLIPAGKFKMGSDIAESKDFVSHFPIHDVTLTRDFWMGKYVVTQNQWQAVMGNNPSIYQKQGPEAPVENVSWDDCQSFISKLNSLQSIWIFRLPSEAEWEYACRANTVTETYAPIDQIAWYGENFFKDSPHPVGMKLPNNFGLYDMLGNVWQWCQDWAQIYSPNPQIDPKGPSTGDSKIRRGAASCISKNEMRASHRWDNPKDWKSEWDGFRLAADLRSKK